MAKSAAPGTVSGKVSGSVCGAVRHCPGSARAAEFFPDTKNFRTVEPEQTIPIPSPPIHFRKLGSDCETGGLESGVEISEKNLKIMSLKSFPARDLK